MFLGEGLNHERSALCGTISMEPLHHGLILAAHDRLTGAPSLRL